MSEYVRLAAAPMWCIQYPTCSACAVDLDTEGDGWTCPVCGTLWDQAAGDGDGGKLYEEWSGERLPGPTLSGSEARQEASRRKHEERAAFLASIGMGRRSS